MSNLRYTYEDSIDNSFNKWIKCRVSGENELEIDYMCFGLSGNQEIRHWVDVAVDIWKTDILPYLR